MSLVRKFAVVVLTILLASTLVTGNLLAAAHLTVLNPDFVQNSVEEENGYELVQDATVLAASSQVPDAINETVDTEALIRESVDQAYLENQTEQNVDRLYAYLHGERDTLNLTVNTVPLKNNIEEAVEAEVREASIAELLEQSDTNLSSLTSSELPVTFNQTTVELMTANESGYQAVKQDVRNQLREEALDRAVQRAWEETNNDEKLYLVIPDYDPRDYTEAEKEQMVADNETEIRSELRIRIEAERGDEIDQQINESLAQANETLAPEDSDAEGLEAAVIDIQATFVEGLTTDMPYEEFRTELDAAKADAAVAIGDETAATLDEQLDDQISLTNEMDAEAQESFETARNGVMWLDRLAIIVPILALVIVGLIYFVTRSAQTVASSVGFSLLSAGLPIYLSLGFIQSRIEQMVETELLAGDPNELVQAGADLMLGILAQLFGRVGAVSLAFILGGVVLLVVWLLVKYGVIGGGGDEAAAAAAAADAEAMDEADATEADDESPDDHADDTATAVTGEADESAVEESDGSGDPLSDVTDDE